MTYVITSIFIFAIVVGIIINNQIIAKKNRIDQAFGSIDAYLKKRFDLIPNLVTLLNKYLTYENDLLLKVTELRTKFESNISSNEKKEASDKLSSLVSSLNVNVENYPELKADKQFLNIQYSLNEIEEQLSAARRAYNANVIDYNDKIQIFPNSIIAKIRNDKPYKVLDIPNRERQNINITELLN